MNTISLKLPDSLLRRLEQESRQRRVTKSALVRAALERELEQPETVAGASCYDLARDLAGSLKKLPKDHSTNPKFLTLDDDFLIYRRHGNKVIPVLMPGD